jgi:hypothetical protein
VATIRCRPVRRPSTSPCVRSRRGFSGSCAANRLLVECWVKRIAAKGPKSATFAKMSNTPQTLRERQQEVMAFLGGTLVLLQMAEEIVK